MSLFIIACGGTGGHLTPGIALAEALLEGGHECLLLVSRKSVDARLLEKYPSLCFCRAPGAGFIKTPFGLLRFLFSQAMAVCFALRLVLRRRPAVFVSFGGFLTFGPTLACRLGGVPVVLHEANCVPGKAVRLLSRVAARVWLPPGVGLEGVRSGVVRHAGFPVRREFVQLAREEARRAIGFPGTGKLLLVLGGSQGASPLNDWVRRHLEAFASAGIHVLCVTGPGKPLGAALAEQGGHALVRFIPFCDKMPEALSAADLVISRSGAGSIAEFISCVLPSVLVPFPFAADNHQEANARFLKDLGACVLVAQGDLEAFTADALRLLGDDVALGQLRQNLRAVQGRFAWREMVVELEAMAAARAVRGGAAGV
ncbi:MAG: UDP-N-acetylglucosamine--N-acetylmuramyl-(pentapeptide) pyrophosphoryl-undecaprenol N-acetylglucosamine transferase [Puniceicoccales bacterium]|jgi:UDP-N-acetylglucosamine--N-acetylmuramyl-(pentapeptide) pyrophosphoryl-undecaprenol N-acetylglucosamine transferase|nr:UDP-N-acetylglucosamine--N-acetylmuramyl-(pentapeptide) pyrophosphoryl-undecaprenol N-acetylglucosamine transferase [Puniceicoccales bacterium]